MASDTEQDKSPPSCPLCTGGRQSWFLWIGLLLFIVIFSYSNRSASVPASFTWLESLEAGMAQASKTNRPIFIKFYATWCGPCQMMDRMVFSEAEVGQALAEWVPVKIDVDRDSEIADRYGVQSLPTFVILSPQGRKFARREGTMSLQDCLHFIQSMENELVTASTQPST